MYSRVYVEITDICNRNCSFCPGTKRAPRQMSPEEFSAICEKLCGRVETLYLHVMGEPLLHPDLPKILDAARDYGFPVCITTNGTLLQKKKQMLIEKRDAIHRVSISLHDPEANSAFGSPEAYLDGVIDFAKEFASHDKNVVFRLWNMDTEERLGKNSDNETILERLHREYHGEWQKRYSGYRLAYRTFLELDGIFTWPSESDASECINGRCHALSRQIAILADGTVVPCCLDSEGLMPLGNIFSEDLSDILGGNMAMRMLSGFREGKMVHPVCRKCTYARRFS